MTIANQGLINLAEILTDTRTRLDALAVQILYGTVLSVAKLRWDPSNILVICLVYIPMFSFRYEDMKL